MKLSRIGRWYENQCCLSNVHCILLCIWWIVTVKQFCPLHIERLFWFKLIANSFCVRRVIDRNPNTDETTTGGEKIDKLLFYLSFEFECSNLLCALGNCTRTGRHWKIANGSNLERVHEISISFEMNFSRVTNQLIDTIEMNVWHWPD